MDNCLKIQVNIFHSLKYAIERYYFFVFLGFLVDYILTEKKHTCHEHCQLIYMNKNIDLHANVLILSPESRCYLVPF